MDLGAFVLINVYVPNAGHRGRDTARGDLKARFLAALQDKCGQLAAAGRQVWPSSHSLAHLLITPLRSKCTHQLLHAYASCSPVKASNSSCASRPDQCCRAAGG